jgi:branched-chain amino acid transport system substrate-binding protein
VGILTSFSGQTAFLGEDVRKAAELEVERINAAGGVDGHPIQLIFEDDGGDPAKAATAFTKLARQDKVAVVTGTFLGYLEPTLRPLAEREQLPLVLLNPTWPEARAGEEKFVFNMAPSEAVVAETWLDYLPTKGYTKVAGITCADPADAAEMFELEKQAPARGIQVIVLQDRPDPSAVDLTPHVSKLKELIDKEKCQAIVSSPWPPHMPAIQKALKQMEVTVPHITYPAFFDPNNLQTGGDELNGLIGPGYKVILPEALPDDDPQKAVALDFKQRYQAKYGVAPGIMGGTVHDTIHLIAEALKKAGADRVGITEALENSSYVGVLGIYRFSPTNHEGFTKESFVWYEVRDKQFVLLKQ